MLINKDITELKIDDHKSEHCDIDFTSTLSGEDAEKMIGKTIDIIFLLNNKRVEAIPIKSLVKEIEIIN